MLSRKNFELEHIVELPFVFKGGTSLLLLLDKPMRLSILQKLHQHMHRSLCTLRLVY